MPRQPYDHQIASICLIEPNMNLRRRQLQSLLEPNEYVITCTTFPRLGCDGFTWPIKPTTPGFGITTSLFFPDEAIFGLHPRYTASIRNNRARRESTSFSNVPIYKDKNTPKPFCEKIENRFVNQNIYEI